MYLLFLGLSDLKLGEEASLKSTEMDTNSIILQQQSQQLKNLLMRSQVCFFTTVSN